MTREARRDAAYGRARKRRDEQRNAAEDKFVDGLNQYREELRKIENAFCAALDRADRGYRAKRTR